MQFGCQTYSWQMLGDQWQGTPDDILDAIAAAGYAGVEFTTLMIGDYLERPADFQAALEQRGLKCAALAYSTDGFTDPAHYDADLAGAETALRFAQHFGVVLGLGGPSSDSQDDFERKFEQACRFYRAVAERARDYGVIVAVHPHSHHTSLITKRAEYDGLLEATRDAGIMFNPDTGHIMRGDQDALDCLKRHRDRIVHVHIKDVDAAGAWQPLGSGISNVPGWLAWLASTGYDGWVVIEEESDKVWQDVNAAIAFNARYLQAVVRSP